MTRPQLTYLREDEWFRSVKSGTTGVKVNLDKLVASRLLAQANSGGGKSRLIRQLLEETHGRIQQFVIDPEGEFATLREKFDYVLAAKSGGDVEASVKTARLLCRRLVELGASAVLDLYDLPLSERREFVKLFLTELMALPRSQWHPILIVIDEAHVFAPERGAGESQSTEAVITLCTQGRKRGFCAVLATQRISKLHKDAAAELLNKFIGRTGLDVDVKRAGDELGLDKETRRNLMHLAPGEFYVYGPAIGTAVQIVRTGPVQTTHPEAGTVGHAAPPAPTKVKALLKQLSDLPQQAAEEARTIAELERQVKQLKGDLSRANRGVAPAADVEHRVAAAVEQARASWTKDLRRVLGKDMGALSAAIDKVKAFAGRLDSAMADIVTAYLAVDADLSPNGEMKVTLPERSPVAVPRPQPAPAAQRSTSAPAEGLSNPQQRMLDALASFEAIGVTQLAKSHVAVFSDQSSRSSGFRNNLSVLSAAGLILRVDSENVCLTDAGLQVARGDAPPATLEELHEAWMAKLTGPQRLMLQLLIAAHPGGVERDDLARNSGQSPLSSGYRNNLSVLSSLGLTTKVAGEILASDLLYPQRTEDRDEPHPRAHRSHSAAGAGRRCYGRYGRGQVDRHRLNSAHDSDR